MIRAELALGAGLTLAQMAMAGGFWITLGNPAANSAAKAQNAVLVVRPDGCGDAAKAQVTATAAGLVNGERRTVRLHPVALGSGEYGIRREWPEEGRWVVNVVAVDGARTTSVVVPVEGNGFRREAAKFYPRAATENEITAALGDQWSARR